MNTNLKNIAFRALLPVVLFAATSCEKVLDIELNEAAPKIVIEANVSDQPGPYQVSLTSTVGFSDPNIFPAVTGAQVILSDNAGNSEVLTETAPGIYKSNTFQGVPGRNYFLKVVAGNKEYFAASSMAQPMPIQSIVVESFEFDPDDTVVTIKFQDPAGIKKLLPRPVHCEWGNFRPPVFPRDQYQDGKLVEGSFADSDLKLRSGDSVRVVLQTIDKNVLNYLRGQDMLSNGNAASPANPTSNFSNGAMGYFSAHGETSATVVVP